MCLYPPKRCTSDGMERLSDAPVQVSYRTRYDAVETRENETSVTLPARHSLGTPHHQVLDLLASPSSAYCDAAPLKYRTSSLFEVRYTCRPCIRGGFVVLAVDCCLKGWLVLCSSHLQYHGNNVLPRALIVRVTSRQQEQHRNRDVTRDTTVKPKPHRRSLLDVPKPSSQIVLA